MLTDPRIERMVAEREQLSTRLSSLRTFIASDTFRSVERAERQRLIRQEAIMTDYVAVLTERLDAFHAAQSDDFQLGKACDLSGEGTCEACQ